MFDLKPQAVFAGLSDPKAIAREAARGKGDKDAALEAAAEACVLAACDHVGERIAAALRNVYGGLCMMEGPREGQADPDGWDAKLDEAVEVELDGIVRQAVGVDGIGEAVNVLKALDDQAFFAWAVAHAKRWAEPVVRAVLKDMSAARLLSAAGVVWPDIQKAAKDGAPEAPAAAAAPKAPGVSEAMAAAVKALTDFGAMFGASSAAELLSYVGGEQVLREQVFSDDPGLRASGMQRIGAPGAGEAFGVLVAAKVDPMAVVAAVFDKSKVPAAATEKPKAAPRKSKRRDQPVTAINGVVKMLRARAGLKDADFAARLGISRSGMVKIANGETGWNPAEPGELGELRAMVNEALGELQAADAALREFGA